MNKNSFESKEQLSPFFERFFKESGPRGIRQEKTFGFRPVNIEQEGDGAIGNVHCICKNKKMVLIIISLNQKKEKDEVFGFASLIHLRLIRILLAAVALSIVGFPNVSLLHRC